MDTESGLKVCPSFKKDERAKYYPLVKCYLEIDIGTRT